MKATGIVRSVDNLGRVVLPMELRRTLNIEEGTPLEIYTDEDKVILKKYQPDCIFCGNMDGIQVFNGKKICGNCRRELKK